ncbi:regulatory protein GntR HTH [Paenibacillus sabinae T27]|uniref:Regulatory protein GntR HTH n=2 Tax=Paenibacillus TaxID=44249 RepID=X5A3T3_9BACL|nr:regulatory protein GntR HTH [Paenibacillus sabinae T27]
MQKRNSRKFFRIKIEEMIQTLRHEIRSGSIAIGSYLPSESDLEVRFGLSNASVRNGLKVLVDEGLIEKIPRVGNRVIPPAPEYKTTIKFGYVNTIPKLVEMQELLNEFGKRYPHIDVQPLELPSGSYSASLKEYLQSEIMDVVLINNNNYQDFLEQGCTELLEPLEEQPDAYRILSEPFRYGDRNRVRPFIFSPVVLCYNKRHFKEAGISPPDSSWTWDDLFSNGRKVAEGHDWYGFYFYLPSRNRWPLFLLQSGTTFDAEKDGEGKFLLCGSKLIDSLGTCRKLISMKDVFPTILSESDADAEALFLQGKVSMIMTTYYFLNQLRHSDLAFDIAPLPRLQNTNTLLIINGLAVNSKSQNKDAAMLLVDFLTSYEAQLLIRRKTLNIAANRLAMEWEGEEVVYRPARFQLYREIFPTYRMVTELGLNNRQLKEIQRDIMMFVSGLLDKGELCRRLEVTLNTADQETPRS